MIKVYAPEVLLTHSSEQVRRAVHDAAWAHEGQFRQNMDGIPYVIHPYGVAVRLYELGADVPTIIAGLFHDAVEDGTPLTREHILREYGEEVAMLVEGVTDRWPASTGLTRGERKQRYRAHVASGEARVHTLKLADAYDNLLGIHSLERRFAKVYLPEQAAMVAVLDKGDAGLRRQVMLLIQEARKLLPA